MKNRLNLGKTLALCLAAFASASGEGASASYHLRNAWADGTRMAGKPPYTQSPFTQYRLRSLYLGSPIQGYAENASHTLQLLGGAWMQQPGDPPSGMGCMSVPNFCSGPGLWTHPSPILHPGGFPPSPVTAVRPIARQLRLSGKLYGSDGNLPVGEHDTVRVDVQVGFYRSAAGDTALYEERHAALTGNPVLVDGGRFTLYLGSSAGSQDLEQVLAANDNLFAEFRVEGQILRPRLPVTGGMLTGTPAVLEGTSDPAAVAPSGTYYRNTAAGSTWIRMTSSWVRIAQ